MARYELANSADKDIASIFDFGIDAFGLEQAIDYQQGMATQFVKLAEQPELYPAVDHIRKGYRRSVYRSHSIYYKIAPNRIFIVRILGQQNPSKAL